MWRYVDEIAILSASFFVVISYLWRQALKFTGRKTIWWRIKPLGRIIEPERIVGAVGKLRRGGFLQRKALFSVARSGREDKTSNLWLGITKLGNYDSTHRVALDIAKECGAALVEHGDAEDMPLPRISLKNWGWKIGMAESSTELKKEDRDKEVHDTVKADLMPEEISTQFADAVETHLDADDMLIIVMQSSAQSSHLRAYAVGTEGALLASWVQYTAPKVATLTIKIERLSLSPLFALLSVLLGVAGTIIYPTILTVSALVLGILAGGYNLLRGVQGKPLISALSRGRLRFPDRIKNRSSAIPFWRVGEWASGGATTALTIRAKPASDAVREAEGTYLGKDTEGRACYLPFEERIGGFFIAGAPGTGKSTLALKVLESDAEARARGQKKSCVWIETKGEGAARAAQVIREAGVRPIVFNISDVENRRLELFDRKDVDKGSQEFVKAMEYTFGSVAIGDRTKAILTPAAKCALAFRNYPEAAKEARISQHHNPVEIMYWLLGGDASLDVGKRVQDAVLGHLPDDWVAPLRQYHPDSKGGLSTARAAEFLDAPRNKMQQLRAAKGVFEGTGRKWVTFEQLLNSHQFVVLNFGPISRTLFEEDEMDAESLGETVQIRSISKMMASISMYMLWDTIINVCDDWKAEGRSISIYSDELSDIAGNLEASDKSIDIIAEMSDKGRSRGVQPVFACQRLSQLSDNTKNAIKSYKNKAYFSEENPVTAEDIATDLGGSYDKEEIRSLPRFYCATRLTINGSPQQAFTLQTEDV